MSKKGTDWLNDLVLNAEGEARQFQNDHGLYPYVCMKTITRLRELLLECETALNEERGESVLDYVPEVRGH